MSLRNILIGAFAEMILHSAGCGSDPMPWQLINQSEEFAPHTNDPQGLAEVLF